jgi:hypothetical protein
VQNVVHDPILLQRMSPLLALSCHSKALPQCRLLGVEETSSLNWRIAAYRMPFTR